MAAAGTWFGPRTFTATEVRRRGRTARPREANGHEPAPVQEPAPFPWHRASCRRRSSTRSWTSLRATGARPPRQLWLPPLDKSAAADELVRWFRGKPWDVDYGKNPGLAFPIGIEDRPRQHRQDVHVAGPVGAPTRLVIGGTAVRCDHDVDDDDDHRRTDVPARAGAVLLRCRGRPEPAAVAGHCRTSRASLRPWTAKVSAG